MGHSVQRNISSTIIWGRLVVTVCHCDGVYDNQRDSISRARVRCGGICDGVLRIGVEWEIRLNVIVQSEWSKWVSEKESDVIIQCGATCTKCKGEFHQVRCSTGGCWGGAWGKNTRIDYERISYKGARGSEGDTSAWYFIVTLCHASLVRAGARWWLCYFICRLERLGGVAGAWVCVLGRGILKPQFRHVTCKKQTLFPKSGSS